MESTRAEAVATQGSTNGVAARPPLFAAHVELPNWSEVAEYLTKHPDLDPVVPVVCDKVRKAMGPAVALSLELYNDPELDDRFLVLYVRQENYPKDFLTRVEAAREPTFDLLENATGHLHVTTDFKPTRKCDAVCME
jgi:hypothetical protein